MIDYDDKSWLDKSEPLSNPCFEISFLLQDRFHFGDPNDPKQFNDPNFSCRTELPQFARINNQSATTAEVLGNEAKMAEHYQHILRLAKKHDISFNAIRHHFWMRLSLIASVDNALSFPWYDTLSECNQLFENVTALEDGETWEDQDQGWLVEFVRKNGRLYIRECDPDDDEVRANFFIEAEIMIEAITDISKNATIVVERLRV